MYKMSVFDEPNIDIIKELDDKLIIGNDGPTIDVNGNVDKPLNEVNESIESEGKVKKNKKVLPYSKNSKKSRNVYGRGTAKKDGAGGKHTWGKPGSEIMTSEIENMDPNYDPENDGNIKLEVLYPSLSKDDLDKAVTDVIKEYLDCGDIFEVMASLNDLNVYPNDINLHPRLKHTLVEMAVTVGMERHEPQREMISCLISDLTGNYISQDHVINGFDALLRNLNDLILDTPDAPQVLGKFIARSVADDALPPKFVGSYIGNLEMGCKLAIEAMRKAETLLHMPHGIVRLDNVWGEGGGNRPVVYLINRIDMLLREFLSSNDIEEAVHCLRDLDVPHFHHEVVYEALMKVFGEPSALNLERMTSLINYLVTSNIVTPDCLRKGLERIIFDLPDIQLDCPGAGRVMQNVLNTLKRDKLVYGEEIFEKLADQRARINSSCSSERGSSSSH